jgi:hypothetical protein
MVLLACYHGNFAVPAPPALLQVEDRHNGNIMAGQLWPPGAHRVWLAAQLIEPSNATDSMRSVHPLLSKLSIHRSRTGTMATS